jgi:type III restriction enzyme
VKSHLSKAVVDSSWETQVARALDESPNVRSWVKNVRLDFMIPYEHQGRRHQFVPDFLINFREPVRGADHLIVEVKGLEREADRSKDVGAHRWIAAVNHWGKLGTWRFAKIYTPHTLANHMIA